MCGRFACSLDKDDLSCATSYKDPTTGTYIKIPCIFEGQTFTPSYNIPPTTFAPVIIRDKTDPQQRRAIVLSRFGVIPPWISNNDSAGKSYRLETHLCRLETMTSSELYKQLLKSGHRCAIPCTGYFEWQSTKGSNRQPYFFYNNENTAEEVKISKGEWNDKTGWTGVKLLYLAGLYSYRLIEGNIEYSFAIITQNAGQDWSWVHHRMPVILQTEDDISNWIDSINVPIEKALPILKTPINNVKAHPVEKSKINNTRNNVPQCVEELSLKKSNFISNWLQTKPKIEGKEISNKENNKNEDLKKKKTVNTLDRFFKKQVENGSKEKTEPDLDITDTQVSEEDILKNYIKNHVSLEEEENKNEIGNNGENQRELESPPLPLVEDSQYVNMKKRTYIAMDDKNCEMLFMFNESIQQEKKAKMEKDQNES